MQSSSRRTSLRQSSTPRAGSDSIGQDSQKNCNGHSGSKLPLCFVGWLPWRASIVGNVRAKGRRIEARNGPLRCIRPTNDCCLRRFDSVLPPVAADCIGDESGTNYWTNHGIQITRSPDHDQSSSFWQCAIALLLHRRDSDFHAVQCEARIQAICKEYARTIWTPSTGPSQRSWSRPTPTVESSKKSQLRVTTAIPASTMARFSLPSTWASSISLLAKPIPGSTSTTPTR